MLPVASPAVPEDDSTVEERLAIRLIRRFDEVAHVERLEPPGSVPPPAWRVTTSGIGLYSENPRSEGVRSKRLGTVKP